MSFSETYERELNGVNETVFGEQGVLERIKQFRQVVDVFGREASLKGDQIVDIEKWRDRMAEQRLNGMKLCESIEKDLNNLKASKRSIFSSQLETTEEVERKKELTKIIAEFDKVKAIFNHLALRTKPNDVSSWYSSPKEPSLLDSSLSLSQFSDVQKNIQKEQVELTHELEKLLELFETFRDMVSEQSLLIEEVQDNTHGALEEIEVANKHINNVQKVSAITIPIVAGGIGALLGGPIGAAFGVKAGLMISGAGVLTSTVGYVIKRQQDQQEKQWEYVFPKK